MSSGTHNNKKDRQIPFETKWSHDYQVWAEAAIIPIIQDAEQLSATSVEEFIYFSEYILWGCCRTGMYQNMMCIFDTFLDQATSIMTWCPTKWHYPDPEPTTCYPHLIILRTCKQIRSINVYVISLTQHHSDNSDRTTQCYTVELFIYFSEYILWRCCRTGMHQNMTCIFDTVLDHATSIMTWRPTKWHYPDLEPTSCYSHLILLRTWQANKKYQCLRH